MNMKKKEVTDGTWVFSAFYKQVNLIKSVEGYLVTFRYPFKNAESGEVYHTSLTYMAKNDSYRLATLAEIDGVNKTLGVAPQTGRPQNNNFKEGDFFYDYSRANVNQIKKIHSPMHFGDSSVELMYHRKGDTQYGMLAYFNDTKLCRPATELEISKFIEEMNAELRQQPIYEPGTWVVVNLNDVEDVNQIRGYDRMDTPMFRYPFRVGAAMHQIMQINSDKFSILRLASDQEIAAKFVFMFQKNPVKMVELVRNLK
jgi:hypothetical protein